MPSKKIRVGHPGHFRDLDVTWPDTEPAPWDADSKLGVVGARVPRLEGRDKVTGTAKYTADVALPGMLFGMVKRCPYAKARGAVNLDRARKHPGVRAAIEIQGDVLFAGQPVAAVAATSEAAAEEALELIDVKWQEQPHAADMEEARRPDSPKVAGGKNPNVRGGAADPSATVDQCQAALKASHVTIDVTFRTPVVTHSCLESHGSVAAWDEEGNLTVWDSTQAIFAVRDGLARALQLSADQVRVIKEHMGGGFGSKLGMGEHSVIAA